HCHQYRKYPHFPTRRSSDLGVSGQDGAYLAKLLLEKGYRVVGTSRDAQVANFANLARLSITDHVEMESMALTDFRSTLQTIAKEIGRAYVCTPVTVGSLMPS